MSHAFAKDSSTCAACVSWGGERALSGDNTLVHVAAFSVAGECRTASSHDYRKITKAYHTCQAWSALPMMKKHGGRPGHHPTSGARPAPRTQIPSGPVPEQAAEPVLPPPEPVAGPVDGLPLPAPAVADAGQTGPATPTVAPVPPAPVLPGCRSELLDIDKTPSQVTLLFLHWRKLRRDRPLPLMTDLDTAQFRVAISRLCLMEPVDDGDDFLYRSCGRAIQRRLGFRPLMRRVRDCHPLEAAERFSNDLRACLDRGEPRCLLVRDDPILPGRSFVELLLPLAGEDGRPATVLAYRHFPGG